MNQGQALPAPMSATTKHSNQQNTNRFDSWFLFSRQGAETPAAGKLVITAG
jgi:hypothetical protein